MSADQNRRSLESEREELLAKMQKHLTPDLKRLIDFSYEQSKKEPEKIEVITSNSTSSSNHSRRA